jgi:hypothetical protein
MIDMPVGTVPKPNTPRSPYSRRCCSWKLNIQQAAGRLWKTYAPKTALLEHRVLFCPQDNFFYHETLHARKRIKAYTLQEVRFLKFEQFTIFTQQRMQPGAKTPPPTEPHY